MYLVGNKCDLIQRAASEVEIESLKNKYFINYFETSAKQNIGIKELFNLIKDEMIITKTQ